MDYLTNHDKSNKEGQQFRANILLCNNLLSLTTNVISVDQNLLSNKGGNYILRINGKVHHQVPNLKEQDNKGTRFAQIIIYDPKANSASVQICFLNLIR